MNDKIYWDYFETFDIYVRVAAEIERYSIWFCPRTVFDGETDDGEGKKVEMAGKEEKI